MLTREQRDEMRSTLEVLLYKTSHDWLPVSPQHRYPDAEVHAMVANLHRFLKGIPALLDQIERLEERDNQWVTKWRSAIELASDWFVYADNLERVAYQLADWLDAGGQVEHADGHTDWLNAFCLTWEPRLRDALSNTPTLRPKPPQNDGGSEIRASTGRPRTSSQPESGRIREGA